MRVNNEKITEPSREIEVVEEVDICILGGSCTGVFAGVRAARLGATVAIVEQQNCFGGVATNGLVNIWHSLWDNEHKFQIIGGLTCEVLERLRSINCLFDKEDKLGINDYNAYYFNSEELKIELDKLVLEHNIKPFLHTKYCSTVVDGDKITEVIVENKSGRSAIRAKMFIDATGDGDLCRNVGVEHFLSSNLQPPTACAKILGISEIGDYSIQQGIADHLEEFSLNEDWGWNTIVPSTDQLTMHAETHIFNVNCGNAEDLTYAEIEGRRQIRGYMDIVRKYAPNGEKPLLASLCSYIGIRQTYQIKSMYQCTEKDFLSGKTFYDAIANGTYCLDVHHNADQESGVTLRYLDGEERVHHGKNQPNESRRWREKTDENPVFYQIPYRAIVPNKFQNLLMCGRMIDAENSAYGAIRVMVNTNQLGEAAGVAAYICVENNCTTGELDTDELRAMLKQGGSIVI